MSLLAEGVADLIRHPARRHIMRTPPAQAPDTPPVLSGDPNVVYCRDCGNFRFPEHSCTIKRRIREAELAAAFAGVEPPALPGGVVVDSVPHVRAPLAPPIATPATRYVPTPSWSRTCHLCNSEILCGACPCTKCSSCDGWAIPNTHTCPNQAKYWAPVERPHPATGSQDVENDYSLEAAKFAEFDDRMERGTQMDKMHVRVKVEGGKLEDRNFFHFAMAQIDPDYHLEPLEPMQQIEVCDRCKGFVWDKAIFTPRDIKQLGDQIGVTATVPEWKKANKCKGQIRKMSVAQYLRLAKA